LLTHEELLAREAPAEIAAVERELEALVAGRDLPVPPYPAVAVRVHELLARKESGLAEVAHVVGADSALAASILRCANSAMYRRGPAVTDLMQAVTRIGAQEVLRLLVASGLASHAQALGPLAPIRRLVWIEGLTSAAVAQELARLRGLRSEEAFVLGLLHDFGKVVATAALELLFETVLVREAHPVEVWAGVLERHHVAVGLALAERWNLPPIVRETIGAHHGPARSGLRDPKTNEVIRVSDGVVGMALSRTGVAPTDLARVPGLASAAEREAVARVLEEVPEFVAAFETPAGAAFVGSPRIEEPETSFGSTGRLVNIGVSVKVAHRPRLFTASAVTADGLVMKGQEPLPEKRLLEAKVYADEPLAIWVLVRMCRQAPDGYRVEIQPFGLSGPARSWWEALAAGSAGDEHGAGS
jgi:putative nucleotidyltransferase with HDIG domain